MGIADNGVSIEMGYGLSDRLVLGGRLELGGESTSFEQNDQDAGDTSSFQVFVGPKLDFMFSPTSKINPFVGAVVGLNHLSGDTESQTMFVLLGRVGFRFFLTEGFSLDPALEGGFAIGGGSVDSEGVVKWTSAPAPSASVCRSDCRVG